MLHKSAAKRTGQTRRTDVRRADYDVIIGEYCTIFPACALGTNLYGRRLSECTSAESDNASMLSLLLPLTPRAPIAQHSRDGRFQ